MEKLLHERLREYVKEHQCGCDTLQGIINIERRGYDNCLWCSSNGLEAIADEIERYYIPRPRFEDGEPVQWGELFRGFNGEECDLAAFTVSSDGHYLLNEYSGDCDFHIKSYSDFVKRPTPKVYDADGVEIKVGDTVWFANSGTERTVKSLRQHDDGGYEIEFTNGLYCTSPYQLTHERPVFDAEGVRYVRGEEVWSLAGIKYVVEEVIGEDKIRVRFPESETWHATFTSRTLTHREPDSIQKILDEFGDIVRPTESAYGELLSRLTALIESGA